MHLNRNLKCTQISLHHPTTTPPPPLLRISRAFLTRALVRVYSTHQEKHDEIVLAVERHVRRPGDQLEARQHAAVGDARRRGAEVDELNLVEAEVGAAVVERLHAHRGAVEALESTQEHTAEHHDREDVSEER